MKKKVSVSIDEQSYHILRQVSVDKKLGNKSNAVEYLLRGFLE